MAKAISYTRFYAFLILLVSAGCASRPSNQCAIRDWYEEGRQHGLDGKSAEDEQLERQIGQQCKAAFHKQNKDLYMNGRDAGLILYCSSQNGFLLGKNEKAYTRSCPAYLEESFLSSFNKGKQLALMERTNDIIEKEMSTLSQQLNRAPASVEEKVVITKRLEQLKRTQKITVNEIKRLKTTAQTF